jgi:TRAP-type uncharacterized transport system fused permease subunit
VSPPTALSPFAAAAITGGNPYITTLQSWKYTLPAFLLPFVFVLDPIGTGLLLKMPVGGTWFDIAEIIGKAAIGIAILAFAAQGRIFRPSTVIETVLLVIAGMFVIFPRLVDGITSSLLDVTIPLKGAIALVMVAAVLVAQLWLWRGTPAEAER